MKKALIILALGGVMFAPANAQQKNDKQLSTAFDKVLEQQFKLNETGVTALVSKNGKIIYKRALGMANLELKAPMQFDNVFRIGSVTKQFTAVAILQLMEKGKLNLQDEITRFIPDYPAQGYKITIEHLLTHTSGIQDFTSIKDNEKRSAIDYTPKEMIDYFKGQPLRFAPGTKWEYSNSGYFLLGYIIERVSGITYGQYLEENFFKPLGMHHSFYANDSSIINNRATGYTRGAKDFENARYISMTQPYAAGSIQSTVEDLFKWNQAIESHTLLKKETLDKALSRYKLNDGTATNYGYGWRLGYIQESPSVWHGGLINGFMSMAIYLPKEDVFVAVFSNCDCKSPADVTAKLAALAIGKPYDHKAIPVEMQSLVVTPAYMKMKKANR
jgi:CubicO group peptidase (beta-lactamase class C family)